MSEPQIDSNTRLLMSANTLADGEFARTYCNGFTFTIGPADVSLALTVNDKPVGMVHCSHSLAKELALKLTAGITDIEKILGAPVPTLDELTKKLIDHAQSKSNIAKA